ncbi:M14 family zinc carboxypeptidase [Solicola sp. PLA-1-18]|uniref:M14 family zinc carboxypeptidase n=1 Tax=Solicola sp. PLA-1-18 TaxID=3380532 RepID=UPI003B77FAFA
MSLRHRTRTLVAAAAAALVVPGLLAATGASAAPTAAAAPTTGFEQRGGDGWTTQPEEQRFLRALDAASARVGLETVGRTAQGRPLQLVTLGDPRPRTAEQVASRSSVLFTCSQHGDEPSGREACLQLARDLAYDTSPATRRFLASTTVMFVPSANPDGTAANTRQNAAGVDINRDHLALATAETQALARVIRDRKPDLVHDLHEFGETPEVYDRQLINLWPRNRNVDDAVHDESVTLNEDYVSAQVLDAGYTNGVYGIWYDEDGEPVAQVAGDGDERILRNTAGLRHSLGILVEANQDPTTAAEETDQVAVDNRRVDTQLVSARASIDFLRENRAKVARATARAATTATELGRTGGGTLAFAGADNELPGRSEVELSPPCAYRLTAAQFQTVSRTLALQGIASTRDGDGRRVSLGQPGRAVAALLLDARASANLVDGTPVPCT